MEAKFLMLGNYVLYNGYTCEVQDIKHDKVRISPIEYKTGKPSKNTGRYVAPKELHPIEINGVILEQMGFTQDPHIKDTFSYKDGLSYYDLETNILTTPPFRSPGGLEHTSVKNEVHFLQNTALIKSGIKISIVNL